MSEGAPHPADLEAQREQKRFQLLPSSELAEKGLICSFLLAPDAVGDLCTSKGITRAHFNTTIGEIYIVLLSMYEAREAIDVVMLTQRLYDEGKLDKVGGAGVVSELYTYLPTATNAKSYADTIIEKFYLRRLILTCNDFSTIAYENQDQVWDIKERFEKEVMSLHPPPKSATVFTGQDIGRMGVAALMKRLEKHESIAGLSTGFPEVDQKTDGMHDTELIVLAARPGVGKSALAGQIMEHLATDQKVPCCLFSLEMGGELLSERCIASMARVNPARWRDGQDPTQADIDRISAAGQKYFDSPIFVEQLSDATVQHLRTAARQMVQQHGVKFIVIDSLSKLRSNSKQGRDNREREVSEAIGGCKELAKELKIPVMVIVHLKRDADGKTGERPMLNQLRESGAIEQDADSVWMLYRREDGTTGLYMPKQRAGGSDEEVRLWFVGEHVRFEPARDEKQKGQPQLIHDEDFPV